MANVIFRVGTKEQYDGLATKDTNTLYWLTDVPELRKGDVLYARGSEATPLASGLMSAADKEKLDSLSAGGITGLTAVDTSLVLSNDENGTTIGVQLSQNAGNVLELKDDGLFVAPSFKLSETNANGLTFTQGGLGLSTATTTSAGAMSAEDKVTLDAVVNDVKTVMDCFVWGSMDDIETA